MEKTWASGAIELLNHAHEHMQKSTAFDKRIAFISIDNAVEVAVKIYLSLPPKFFPGEKPTSKEKNDAHNSFTSHLALAMQYSGGKIDKTVSGDIEHYHRIRNTLYHEGTGLSVDEEYLDAYFTIGELLLKKLFDVELKKPLNEQEYSISNLIRLWDVLEETMDTLMKTHNVFEDTYKWEEMMHKEILDIYDITSLTTLRLKRNFIVHSEKGASMVDIRLFIDETRLLLGKLQKR